MAWVLLAVVLWVVGLLAVPEQAFRRLVPFGVVAGFGLALAVNLVGGPILGLWGFNRVTWPLLGIPFWVLLAWVPAVILFVYYLPDGSLARAGWILLFPAVYTAIDYVFLRAGLRHFAPNWNIVYSFLLSLGVHLLILSFYLTSVVAPGTRVSATEAGPHAGPGKDRQAEED
ncbi:MAG: hypothetical protein K6U08_02065 [Firmicutes bacterium]|nr:hypothetical protein [Bacillota bacterium]